MHSSPGVDDMNFFALKSSNRCSREYNGAMNGLPDRAIAHLVCKDRVVDYWMKKSRITVGRSSSKRSSADVDMGQSTFISRNHLEIYTTDARLYALVTGKNGVFVDDVFHKKGGPEFELPNSCILRFPSTDIKINFEALLPDSTTVDVKPQICPEPLPIQTSAALKSNSYGEFYPAHNSNFNVLDGAFYPIKEEIVDHVASSDPVDIKKFEPTSDYTIVHSAPVKREEKEAGQAPPKPLPAPHSAHPSQPNDQLKPPFSYAQLIVQAITSQIDRQLTLSGIYSFITRQYPFYRHGDKGWQNSIRHNLSLNRYFVKVPRAQEEAGKGCFWKVEQSSEAMLMGQAYRKRRQRPTPYGRNNSLETVQPPSTSDSNTIISTPDDSCASWDGNHGNGEEVEVPMQPPPPPPEHPSSTSELRCFPSVNKPAYNAVPYAAVNLFSNLPAGMNKSHFIFTKPLPVSSSPSSNPPNNEQVISSATHPPTHIMSSPSNGSLAAQEVYSHTGDHLKATHESQDMKSKLHQFQIMSQPKTIILRPTVSNSLNFSMPTGSQLIKLSYAPQIPSTMNKPSDPSLRSSLEVSGDIEVKGSNPAENGMEGTSHDGTISLMSADISLAQNM